jgi:hypothetical protein
MSGGRIGLRWRSEACCAAMKERSWFRLYEGCSVAAGVGVCTVIALIIEVLSAEC